MGPHTSARRVHGRIGLVGIDRVGIGATRDRGDLEMVPSKSVEIAPSNQHENSHYHQRQTERSPQRHSTYRPECRRGLVLLSYEHKHQIEIW